MPIEQQPSKIDCQSVAFRILGPISYSSGEPLPSPSRKIRHANFKDKAIKLATYHQDVICLRQAGGRLTCFLEVFFANVHNEEILSLMSSLSDVANRIEKRGALTCIKIPPKKFLDRRKIPIGACCLRINL